VLNKKKKLTELLFCCLYCARLRSKFNFPFLPPSLSSAATTTTTTAAVSDVFHRNRDGATNVGSQQPYNSSSKSVQSLSLIRVHFFSFISIVRSPSPESSGSTFVSEEAFEETLVG
jgi:hypothetical protein